MANVPQIRTERCTRFRFRYSNCSRCADACPHDAVTLTEVGVAIDAAKCRDCGLCVAGCPTEVLVSDKIDHVAMIKRAVAKEAKEFSFACTPAQAAADAEVPCLGDLDATFLAFLSGRGVAVELRGAWHCDDCPHGARGQLMIDFALGGYETLRAHAESGEEWPAPLLADKPNGPVEKRIDDSKRQLFRRLFGRAAAVATSSETAARPAVEPRAIRAANPYSTIRRELIGMVWPAKGEGEYPLDDALPLNAFTVNDRCNHCELCARACPTGALAIVETDADWCLTFDYSRCVGCDVCLEACQPMAIQRLATVPRTTGAEKAKTTLRARRKIRCARCDRFFMPAREDEKLCRICSSDDADFDAIFG